MHMTQGEGSADVKGAEDEAHFLLSSRPAAFSKWEQVMMQPPCMTSIMGRFANSLEVHLMYRSRSWPPRKNPVSLCSSHGKMVCIGRNRIDSQMTTPREKNCATPRRLRNGII